MNHRRHAPSKESSSTSAPVRIHAKVAQGYGDSGNSERLRVRASMVPDLQGRVPEIVIRRKTEPDLLRRDAWRHGSSTGARRVRCSKGAQCTGYARWYDFQ